MVQAQLKNKTNEKKDWKHIEFFAPINETFIDSTTKEFFIKGVAINETTTRNGITYIASELEKAAPSFRNKPILADHQNSVFNIVGRTTENVNFAMDTNGLGRIDFEARIMDKTMQEMINDGRIQNVSIGTMLEDLQEDEETGIVTAIGMEGLEISLVAVPGDPGAGLANALHESMILKSKLNMEEIEMSKTEEDKRKVTTENEDSEESEEKETDESEEEVSDESTEDNDEKSDNLSDENKLLKTKLAKFEAKEADKKFKSEVANEVAKQLKKLSEDTPVEEPEEEDETKGTVSNGDSDVESDASEEGFVLERAETGNGFALWRDYKSEEASKYKRLCR